MQNSGNKWGISVVIPNYNGRQLLEQNLPHTYTALKASNLPWQIIVADDASTDESVAYLTEKHPEVILIAATENKGFSTNMNCGIAAAGYDLVLLLNSDIKLSEDYFIHQMGYFEHAGTFGVMGQILDDSNSNIAEACKYPLNALFKINYFKNIDINNNEAYTYYLSGANALVSRQKLIELGGFNELFSPYYHEDLDLSLRAWERGWKCYYQHNAVCRHAVSATINKHSLKSNILTISTRNKLLLHYFHHIGTRLYLWQMVTALSLLVRWFGGKYYYYNAYRLYLQRLPQMQLYKKQFIATAKAKQQYIPFVTVKANVKNALDKIK